MSEDDRVDEEGREPEGGVPTGNGEPGEGSVPDEAAEPREAGNGEPAGDAGPGEPREAGDREPATPGDAKPPAEPAPRRRRDAPAAEEVVPGADLEPDLVLDEERPEEERYADAERYPDADAETAEAEPQREEPPPAAAERPAPRSPMELAADARYSATGKRKTSVARVVLKPGDGAYTVNGRSLDEFFPRPTLQKTARQPLATAGYDSRMDVVAKLHGGGVSSQAGALRHGVARALVEADPSLRGELKRRGFLTRDPRVKERKKAGLKKARKRPQFSKR